MLFIDQTTIEQILINLRLIFITHIHGDHQIGILKILFERAKAIESNFTEQDIIENKSEFEIFVGMFIQILYQSSYSGSTYPY